MNTPSGLPLDDNVPSLDGAANKDSEPPYKKRKLERGEPGSPPWKRAVAEGPSSFTQDGKRKSARTNSVPLELQPQSDKRQTRGAVKTNSKKDVNGHGPSKLSRAQDGFRKAASAAQIPKSLTDKPPSSKRSYRKSILSDHIPSPSRLPKIPATPKLQASGPEIVQSNKMVKVEDHITPGPAGKARIKLRLRPPTLPMTNPGLLILRPKFFPTLREYIQKAGNIHIDQGGLLHPDDPSEYPPGGDIEDAKIILRAEAAAEPGGILAPGTCKVYSEIDEWQQIPQQYSHVDHMCRAAIGFRKLLLLEQRSHRQTAKRIAEACKDEWLRRQPKTAEQIEAELIKASHLKYKGLVKTLQATWDNVRAEVNRRRFLEWEAQEQARVRKALSEAVDKSQQKLQERRAHIDSDILSDQEEPEDESDTDDEMGSGSESDGESNMSSEGSEADEDHLRVDPTEDETLTVEQLREKYAELPGLPSQSQDEEMADGADLQISEIANDSAIRTKASFDDSDESIDMDDDLGSSDDNSGNDDINDSETGEEDDDEDIDDAGETSLLGFLTASEIRSVAHSEVQDPESATEIMDMNDDNEVLSIPDRGGTNASDENTAKKSPAGRGRYSNGFEPHGDEESNDQVPDAKAREGDEPSSEDPKKQTTVLFPGSSDRSSQPTPVTAETRLSDSESASSIDFQHASQRVTQSATPQPSNGLKTPVPFLLRGTLREYQHYGLDWLAGLYSNNTNGILADEMGLGKTIQTIALLAHLACMHEEWGPHLVIVPTSVILNWEMEFKKWCPGFKILTYYGTQEERKKKRAGWRTDDTWNVCITSYQIIIRDQQVFKRRRWHYMILDEAHNIKNFNSQRWQTMLTFNTRARLLLTGTPLQNSLTELWSLLYFLMPSDGTNQGVGGFADLKEFQDWFKKPSEQILEHGREQMDDEARGIISKLHKLLRPYLLRRLKADVEKQMPAKYEHVEYCRLSKRQRELYDGFLSRDDTRGPLASGNYLSIINCLMQLRKVCNHPDLFVDRPISTSFPMEKSAVADFEIKELLVRRRLLKDDPMAKASFEFLNLIPTTYERLSEATTSRSAALSAQRILMDMREAQRLRAQNAYTSLDPSTAKSNLIYLESATRWGRFEELQHCVYLNALRRQQKPIYGSRLVELLTLGLNERPHRPQPRRRNEILTWLESISPVMLDMVKPLSEHADALKSTIQRFACVTPAVVAKDIIGFTLTRQGIDIIQKHVDIAKSDPFHEVRMRLSIQFPDKRLLQYDCGKLQSLDKLLRKLQAGGHRVLIFTQMTKVLDILEQFLNIHGHKYLRLDGSTKVEQRQVLTDRFNNDTRILAFILSSRSGGLGINLTGADTVIFYDLDWNPAMDKQCQDRCHRIGQTRDVHIYRLVSEHTIEANILRKANQKRMLDDVVIQEGEFTTDYFNKISVQDVISEEALLSEGDAAANAAMDRVLGGPDNNEVKLVLAQAEDREDVIAARLAEREIVQTDAADFDESTAVTAAASAVPGTPGEDMVDPNVEDALAVNKMIEVEDEDELNAWGQIIHSTDDYMLGFMAEQLKDTPVELPKDKSKSKKGRDHRPHRVR